MTLTNEYENLLRYLETEKNKWEKEIPKKFLSPTSSTLKPEDYKNLEINMPNVNAISTSNYFDVSVLEKAMRDRSIQNFKNKQTKEKTTVSVSELLTCVRKNYYFRKKMILIFMIIFDFLIWN